LELTTRGRRANVARRKSMVVIFGFPKTRSVDRGKM
jgi:hypothetical protein